MTSDYIINEKQAKDIQYALEVASKFMRQLTAVTESDWEAIAKAELAIDANWANKNTCVKDKP